MCGKRSRRPTLFSKRERSRLEVLYKTPTDRPAARSAAKTKIGHMVRPTDPVSASMLHQVRLGSADRPTLGGPSVEARVRFSHRGEFRPMTRQNLSFAGTLDRFLLTLVGRESFMPADSRRKYIIADRPTVQSHTISGRLAPTDRPPRAARRNFWPSRGCRPTDPTPLPCTGRQTRPTDPLKGKAGTLTAQSTSRRLSSHTFSSSLRAWLRQSFG